MCQGFYCTKLPHAINSVMNYDYGSSRFTMTRAEGITGIYIGTRPCYQFQLIDDTEGYQTASCSFDYSNYWVNKFNVYLENSAGISSRFTLLNFKDEYLSVPSIENVLPRNIIGETGEVLKLKALGTSTFKSAFTC